MDFSGVRGPGGDVDLALEELNGSEDFVGACFGTTVVVSIGLRRKPIPIRRDPQVDPL